MNFITPFLGLAIFSLPFATLNAQSSQQGSTSLNCASQQLSAQYHLLTQLDNQPAKSSELVLWRRDHQIAHQNTKRQTTQKWSLLKNGRIAATHFYDQHQRGIEYQPGELSKNKSIWQKKFQLIPQSMINDMTLVSQQGSGCNKTEVYRLNTQQQGINTSYELEWLPNLQLVKSYRRQSNDQLITWDLAHIEYDRGIINDFFNLRDNYNLTDYADIGDNESDPFLLSMINLGF